jgi:hypothetical protein
MQMMLKLRSVSYSTWLLLLPFAGRTAMPEEKAVAAGRQLMVMVMATHKSCSFQLLLRPLLVVLILCLHIHRKKGTMNMLLLLLLLSHCLLWTPQKKQLQTRL